jgi:XRE family transcriptional regulator of biofilm formation
MIGENIQKIRHSRGLTLSELAERAHISKSYLSNIERNLNQNPSIQIIEKIASVLGVDFRMLIGMKNRYPEEEWLDFVNDLKDSGVGIEELQEFKMVIEFAKWQNKQLNTKE